MPELLRSDLGRGAGSFSLVAAAYAAGSIVAGVALARRPVARKALGSLFAWILYLPAYGLFAFAARSDWRSPAGRWRAWRRRRRSCS